MKRLLELTNLTAAVLALPLAAAALCAQTVRITSPADGAVVKPGESLAVTVATSGATFRMVAVIGENPIGFSQVLTAPPYRFSVRIPSHISPRRYSLTAVGNIAPGQNSTSDPISIDVERPDAPVSVSAEPSFLRLEVGGRGYLRLIATYGDTSTADIGQSTLTTCSSDSVDVATVTNDGRVVAAGPGSARITVENGGQTTVVPVTVEDRRPVRERPQ
jgi:uncharacterized protein YjdB